MVLKYSVVKTLSLREFDRNRTCFVNDLYSSLCQCGFVVLKDHGIPKALLAEAYNYAEKLFALTEETKQNYLGEAGHRGYTAFGVEKAAGRQQADLKEFWHIGRSDYRANYPQTAYAANIWPEELAGFKTCFEALYRHLEHLGLQMLRAIGEGLAANLGGGTHYGDFFEAMAVNGNSVCRLLHYPPVAEGQQNQMRAAPHADINLLTLLIGASDSGLQLLDKNGEWLPVQSSADEIVLDTGDMMARLTNNYLPATVHRVVNESTTGGSRYSMPFFLHPRSEVVLESIAACKDGNELPAITAGDFLTQRLQANGLL